MRTFDYLPVETVKAYIPMMEKRGVSKVARSRGFTKLYIQGFDPGATKSSKNLNWEQVRHNYLKRRLAQPSKLFDRKGVPSRYHLSLISWAYSPNPKIRRLHNRSK